MTDNKSENKPEPTGNANPETKPKRQWEPWLRKYYGWVMLGGGLSVLVFSIAFAAFLFATEFEAEDVAPMEVTLTDGQKVMVRTSKETGVPEFMSGSVAPPPAAPPKSPQAVVAFFEANKDVFHMTDPAQELTVKRSEGDSLGMTHIFMSQVYQSVPVYGHEMAVHFSADGKISTVNGDYAPGINISIEPKISADKAVEEARDDLEIDASPPQSKPPQLVIYAPEGKGHALAWKFTMASNSPLTRMLYFVDAGSGDVLDKFDEIMK